jgi:hypothetical protein
MDSISKINIGDKTYSINDSRISYKRVIMSYNSATDLYGYAYMGGDVLAAVATIIYKDSTPFKQVTSLVVEPGAHSVASRCDLHAYGSGFVSGHVLTVDIIALIKA